MAASEETAKKEWFGSLKKAIEDGQNKPLRRHKIQKVAKVLREKNEDCFEPIAVSIGPYHRNKPHLQRMEKLKAPMLGQYVNALNCPMEWLYCKVEEVAAQAKECYAADATREMSDLDFNGMMFLDGCFFLQFIMNDEVKQMSWNDWVCVKRDLFLLENQLPFIVLQALSPSSDPVKMMVNFIANWPHHPLKEEQSSGMMDRCRNLCNPQRKKEQSNAEKEEEQSKTEGEAEPIHLLQLLRQSLLNPEDLQGKESGHGSRSSTKTVAKVLDAAFHTYRSATELKKVGIHFRKSQTHRFTDVGFRKNLGLLGVQAELRLPPMVVQGSTKSRLLNLVAYEMCVGVREVYADVTSYVCFLDYMIDSAEDVKELRSHGILINHLGSDQQVADLFNKIADDLVPNRLAYYEVNHQIEKHYKSKFKIWVLERLYTHFKAPWSRLSFVAALIILLLTFIQAFYAVMQGKRVFGS